ncbi:protein C19orf12 homolog [Mytilus californianus]|uniref:protein C19orf12 homolog n=1 Tax=Mytilus californianus TaxID=6549 RepID=UPI002246E91F|nr:protein C19orf12 homolog [Mytilus californianus]XP_052099681.1 protein C19orf12 homolog [Mytilus californianus]XP_052099682.1 protein C19orf12 homolog [Mytilus californianus]
MAGIIGRAFIPYYNQLMEILSTNPDLRASAKGIFKQVAYGACGTAIGGVVGGPPGALVGGIGGSVLGYLQSDEYDSLLKVLYSLSDSEKAKLVQKVQEQVGDTGIEALTRFVGTQAHREVLLNLIRKELF